MPWLQGVKAQTDAGIVWARSVAELCAVLTALCVQPRISPGLAGRLIHENVLVTCQIIPSLVHTPSGHEVKTVMVSRTGIVRAGKVLVRDGEVLVSDEAAVRAEAQVQAEEIARRVTADPVHREMALLEPMARGLL